MKLDIYPTRIECVDEAGESVFSVTSQQDGIAAYVEVTSVLTTPQWDQIAPLIRQALVDLRLAETESAR